MIAFPRILRPVGASAKLAVARNELVVASRCGEVVFRPNHPFNGIKVFSATMFEQRKRLGEVVTEWITAHPDIVLVDATVTQSSDAEYHCLAITVAYWQPIGRRHANGSDR